VLRLLEMPFTGCCEFALSTGDDFGDVASVRLHFFSRWGCLQREEALRVLGRQGLADDFLIFGEGRLDHLHIQLDLAFRILRKL
jgi:hypothetical protein